MPPLLIYILRRLLAISVDDYDDDYGGRLFSLSASTVVVAVIVNRNHANGREGGAYRTVRNARFTNTRPRWVGPARAP